MTLRCTCPLHWQHNSNTLETPEATSNNTVIRRRCDARHAPFMPMAVCLDRVGLVQIMPMAICLDKSLLFRQKSLYIDFSDMSPSSVARPPRLLASQPHALSPPPLPTAPTTHSEGSSRAPVSSFNVLFWEFCSFVPLKQ
jgi:hypothetical protein